MRKWLVSSLVALALLLHGPEVYAGKGGSVGGGSSGRSYSTGSKPSSGFGRGSSIGQSTKPSATGSGGRTYSTGSPPAAKPSAPTPSTKPSTPSAPAASGSGGRTYSTGEKPSTPAPSTTAPSGRSYSTGGNTDTRPPPNSNSAKPNSSGWNPGLSGAAQREQSKQNYNAATRPAETPKPTYKTPKGTEKPIKADAPQVQTVKRYVTHERYVTYETRSTTFYGPSIYAHPYYYDDFFSPFMMGYLFSSAVNANERAYWVYCHRQDMDNARYRDMVSKDAELEARLRELERKEKLGEVTRNQNYVVPGMKSEPDLQYSHDFVESVYNPQSNPTPSPSSSTSSSNDSSGGSSGVGAFFFWFFMVILVVGICGFLVYVFFIREY
jgi:hypothetical protein